jgi:hypothetical protein
LNIFQTVLVLEPLIKLNQFLNDDGLQDNILKMLDFLLRDAYIGGKSQGNNWYQPFYLPFALNIKTGLRMGTAPGYNFMTSNALAYAYMVTGESDYLRLSRQLFKDAVFYWQEETNQIDSAKRSPIAYAAAHFPGSRSKIHGWINRYPQYYLYMEANPKKDTIPPDAINDLEAALGIASGTVDLDWTAPVDNGSNTACKCYRVKYATHYLGSRSEWLQAENAVGEPVPQAPYSLEHFTVQGLTPGKTYFFTIRAYDRENNQSPLSNVVSITLKGDG